MGRVYGEKRRARSKKRGARYSYSGAMRREMSRRATAERDEEERRGEKKRERERDLGPVSSRREAACIAAELRDATRDEEKGEGKSECKSRRNRRGGGVEEDAKTCSLAFVTK